MSTERDAEEMLRSYTDRFLGTVAEMSESQWTYRAPAGGWSVSEITEHVSLANGGVGAMLRKRLETPLPGPLGVADDEIPYLFYLGDEPPEVAPPTGTWTSIPDALTAFEVSAVAVLDWAAATDLDLRAHGAAHPVFGVMDGTQWLLFAAAHTERHRRQVLGLQGRPDFPASGS